MSRFSVSVCTLAAAVFAFTSAAFAQNQYIITDAFVRATPSKTTAGYMNVENKTGTDDALVAAKADWAERAELHNVTKDDNGVMNMVEVKSIALPANGTMVLKSGGYHIMFFGVKEALQENDHKKVTLEFANGNSITHEFVVKPITATGAHNGHAAQDGHHHGH